ncbi:unnamed protein product, partial [Staurois parvus]
MLLPRSRFSHGAMYGPPHCCCLHRHTLPCASFQVSSHCWCVEFFDIGCWADYGPPYSCCQAPLICHGPLIYRPPHAAAKSRVSHGSLYGLPLLLSPSPHSAMCHFQVPHTAGVFEFFD